MSLKTTEEDCRYYARGPAGSLSQTAVAELGHDAGEAHRLRKQSDPVCPYCGWKMDDAWDLGMEGDQATADVECGSEECGLEFRIYLEVSVSYTTEKLATPEQNAEFTLGATTLANLTSDALEAHRITRELEAANWSSAPPWVGRLIQRILEGSP